MKTPSPLTARFVETVNKPGRYGDGRGGHGLILNVHRATNGRVTKSWVQRIQISGRVTQLGLGPYPVVTLGEARKVALENRRAAYVGKALRAPGIPSFAEAADKVIEIQRPTWRDGKSEDQWRSSLATYVFPKLGDMTVDQITTADVLGVLMHDQFWNMRRTTAKRVRQRIGAIMKWAIAQGHRADNPAGDALGATLPKNGVRTEHHRALPYERVGDALRRVRASDAYVPAALAFEFLVLTAARSGEVRGAQWNEIDWDNRTWTVPADRMKMQREHRVPLSDRAIDVSTEAREISGDDGLIFPSVTGRMMQSAVLSELLRDTNVEAVPHGFRSSFRQWSAECTDFPREVCEHALAHVNGDKVEAAYQRSDLFEKRAELMHAWADYL